MRGSEEAWQWSALTRLLRSCRFSAFLLRCFLRCLDRLQRAGLAVRKLNAGAGAALHELPRIALEVDGRGALAGRARTGGAIVLALQRDAKAFLLLRRDGGICLGLGQRSCGGYGRKRSRDGASEDKRTDDILH